jgi:hypothetical protein
MPVLFDGAAPEYVLVAKKKLKTFISIFFSGHG